VARTTISYTRCADGVAIGDFNGDTHLDVACSSYGGYYIPRGLAVHYGPDFLIHELLISGEKVQGIVAHDMDGDGYAELVAAGEKVSVWHWSSLGWSRDVLEDSLSIAVNPFARLNLADLDCDGDVDIVVATACPRSSGNMLVWYENTGAGWMAHTIDSLGNRCYVDFPSPYGVRVGLLDETSDTGRADVVLFLNRVSVDSVGIHEMFAYYNVTDSISCSPLSKGSELRSREIPRNDDLHLRVMGNILTIEGKGDLKIYRSDGRLLRHIIVNGKMRHKLPTGVYIIKFAGKRRVVVVR